MKLYEIIKVLEDFAPPSLQESYDNSGLLIGHPENEIYGIIISLNTNETVLQEAIDNGFNLIISHHPLIFKGLKKLNDKTAVERLVRKAIRNDINIYAIHTNLDNVLLGVNHILAKKIGLSNTKVLSPIKSLLKKLVTFCPLNEADKVRQALFDAEAGHIGNYDSCSFNTEGTGTFRALDNAQPFVGKIGELHKEKEVKIEVIFPEYREKILLDKLLIAHPYEEVAYDIYPLHNHWESVGAGLIGEIHPEQDALTFLNDLKESLSINCIRHSSIKANKIKKVAICGGSGSFLIPVAAKAGADIMLTADLKYHDFPEKSENMIIADIGHHESEIFSKDLIYNLLIKKFPTFAVQISKLEKNPVNYL